MGKIDCTNVFNFMREWERRNRIEKDTYIIPDCMGYNVPVGISIEKSVDELQKWSDEHPVKTRKDKFFEVFSKNKLNICGYDCPACLKNTNCKDCKKWWDEVVE